MAMRLVTRSDFDGLACGALLLEQALSTTGHLLIPKIFRTDLLRSMRMTVWRMCLL